MVVIPARKGSKRFPGKNMAKLGGKPLIAHAIEAATTAGVERIVVTTDDPAVLSLCRSYPVATIVRPPTLCLDRTVLSDVMVHALQNQEEAGFRFDAACLMTPTAPLRSPGDVTGAIYALRDDERAAFVLTVTTYEHNPHYALAETGSFLAPAFLQEVFRFDRSQLPTLWRPVAVCHVGRWAAILQQRTMFGSPALPYYVPAEQAVDIDTPLDLEWARFLLEKEKSAWEKHGTK